MPELCPPAEKSWLCDNCRAVPGTDWFDGFWFCEACRQAYIERVSREAIS